MGIRSLGSLVRVCVCAEGFPVFYVPLLFFFHSPTPQIEWNKMGGDLPKGRETKENYGKTLKIDNVSFRDKGNYRCTASNSLGEATHDFHVVVEGAFPLLSSLFYFHLNENQYEVKCDCPSTSSFLLSRVPHSVTSSASIQSSF